MYSCSIKSLIYTQFWNGVRNSFTTNIANSLDYHKTLVFSGVRISLGKQKLSMIFWHSF